MKLFTGELRKQLFGKTVIPILLAMLLFNSIFAYIYAKDNDTMYFDALVALDKDYVKDPERIKTLYEQYNRSSEEYNKAIKEWLRGGKEGDRPIADPVPYTYTSELDDESLMYLYFTNVISDSDYKQLIDDNIDKAYERLRDFDYNNYDHSAFAYRYQIKYIVTYTNLRSKINLNGGYVYGWDILFSYSGTFLFAALFMMFLGCRIFSTEKDSGMHLILRTTNNGRAKLAFNKMLTLLVFSIVVSLLFYASSYAVIDVYKGFSSWSSPVQQIKDFRLSPHLISIFGCFMLTIAFTAITIFAMSIMTACFSLITKYSFASLICSTAVCGIFYIFSRSGSPNFSKYANIFTVSSAKKLFGSWRALHVGEHPTSQIIPILVIIAAIVTVSSVSIFIIWQKRGMGVGQPKAKRLISILSRKLETIPRLRIASGSLLRHEMKKLLPGKTVIICILIILAKLFSASLVYNGGVSYQTQIKQKFIEQYASDSLDEEYRKVCERSEYYQLITSKSYVSDMAVKRIDGEITFEEYQSFREEYDEAVNLSDLLGDYKSELEYLIDKKEETGISTKPIVSTGLVKLFSGDFDIALVALLIVVLCGVFSREYESGFISLLKSTKKGRNDVFIAKIISVCTFTSLLSIAFYAIDLLFVFNRYDMSFMSSPLFAVQRYSCTTSAVTVGKYLLIVGIMRTVAYTLFGLLISGLSGTLCYEWSTAGVAVLVFIPYLLCGLGIGLFEYADISVMLSFDRMYLLTSAKISIMALIMLIWSVIALVFNMKSRKKLCK